MSNQALAFVSLFAATLGTASAAITVESYSYNPGPSGLYNDGGGKLTDGIANSQAWGTGVSSPDISAFIGWQFADFSITFNFAAIETIRSVSVWSADSDGYAGVYLPASFTLRTADNAFSRSFNVIDPEGNGHAVELNFGGFKVETNQLILDVTRNGQWTMLSEVTFHTIPEPATGAALVAGAATLGLLVYRRQRTAKAQRQA